MSILTKSDTKELALIIKDLNKFLEKMCKQSKLVEKSSKSNNSSKHIVFNKKNTQIQGRKCKGYGHIQFECANTLKEKSKPMTTAWWDAESNGDQEKDENNVNHIAFTTLFLDNCVHVQGSAGSVATNTVSNIAKLETIATKSKTTTNRQQPK